MATEIFTAAQFAAVLPSNATHLGLVQGEHTWAIPVSAQMRLVIRSSIGASGLAAGTGQDSIRLWIEYLPAGSRTWRAAGKGPDAYTTRVKGWQARLQGKIAETTIKALKVKRTIQRGDVLRFAKTTANMGRPFVIDYKTDAFRAWVD